MAGNYPDVPSWRIPYDRDGTVIVWNNDDVTDTYARTLNDESGSGHVEYAGSPGLIFMFPRLMDLDAYAASRSGYGSPGGGFSWSPDTTNGIDGTWNSLGSWVDCGTGVENIRNNIQGMALSGVRAIRWWTSSNGGVHKIDYIHLYGEPTPGEDTNKLQIVQTATETRVTPAYFDLSLIHI